MGKFFSSLFVSSKCRIFLMSAAFCVVVHQYILDVCAKQIQNKENSIVLKIESYLKGIKYISSDFVQYNFEGDTYLGHIWLSKADRRNQRVRIDYTDGINQKILIHGKNIRVINKDNGSESSYPISQTPIYTILDEGLDFSREKYKVLSNNKECAQIYITRKSQMGDMGITLIFSKYPNGNIKNLVAWKIMNPDSSVNSFIFVEDTLFVNDSSKISQNIFQ